MKDFFTSIRNIFAKAFGKPKKGGPNTTDTSRKVPSVIKGGGQVVQFKKLESAHIQHFRCFDNLVVSFDPNLTVFVGVNGSGKTSLLDSISIFQKIISRIMLIKSRTLQLEYFDINLSDIKKGGTSCRFTYDFSTSIKSDLFDLHYSINDIDKDSRIKNSIDIEDKIFDYQMLSNLIIVYYTSKRIINDYQRQVETQGEKRLAYINAFNSKIDFSSTLSWFIEKSSEEAREAVNRGDLNYRIPELSAVRDAVSLALGDYHTPYVINTPPELCINRKEDAPRDKSKALTIEQLSDGYRTMLALVMDLARRMAVANADKQWPAGESVLHSPGIVLIDEVELHLHPSWQQKVLPSLMQIFPNVQFIVTTHSPQVITSIAARHIRILRDNRVFSFSDETQGAEANRVLEDVFQVSKRPDITITKKLEEYTRLVYDEKWDSEDAENLRKELVQHYGSNEPKLLELALHVENSKWERGL